MRVLGFSRLPPFILITLVKLTHSYDLSSPISSPIVSFLILSPTLFSHLTCFPAFRFSAGLLATAGLDRDVRLWDAETGDMRQSLEGHTGEVSALLALPGKQEGKESCGVLCLVSEGSKDVKGNGFTCFSWDGGGHALL